MSAFQTILTDRILSYTPGGHIEVDSPVTFTQPVNIPGGVSDQTINVDTINPFTPSGPVTVTTDLIVTSGNKLETNEISAESGSSIAIDDNIVMTALKSITTDVLLPRSGTSISTDGLTMSPSSLLLVNTIDPSAGSQITVGGEILIPGSANYINLQTSSMGPLTKRLVMFEAVPGQGSTKYNGFYVDTGRLGVQIDLNNSVDFNMSTGASTGYLGMTVLGNGGTTFYTANVNPGNPASGHTVYSDGSSLYAINSSGFHSLLTSKYIEIYASSNGPTTTIISLPVSVQATTWSANLATGFTNNSTTNNLITYTGPDTTNVRISVTMTISSTTNGVAASLGFYKNPTFSGSAITGGTILEASTAVSFDNANSFYPLSTQMLATLASGDTISLYINATAVASITADTCNLIIETL